MRRMLRALIKVTGWFSALVFFKPKIIYENKRASRRIRGRAVIISNHKKVLDFIFFLLLFFDRFLRCVVGETIFESNRITRWFLTTLGSVKADRLSADPSFIYECVDILDRGGAVMLYPESRLPDSDEMLPFKPAAALIALQGNAPVIPVYHAGNYGLFRRERVVIGEPITLSGFASSLTPSSDELNRITAMLQEKIQELKLLCEAV